MRLMDWIITRQDWKPEILALRYKELITCELLVIDNVARYYYQSWPGEVMQLSDFPNLAPPFRSFFMEWKNPTKININGAIQDTSQIGGGYSGVYVEALDMTEISFAQRTEALTRIGATPWLNRDIKWCMATSAWGYMKNRGPYAWKTAVLFFVAEDGTPIIGEDDTQYAIAADPEEAARISCLGALSTKRLADFFVSMTQPALLAISFLHCKNIYETIERPPAGLAKKRKKQGIELVKYKTLIIEPIRKILKNEGESETKGIKYALHICRGHFKDYTAHGLFGRNKGIYWWPQHVRGDISEGIIVKDYQVKRP